MLWHASDTNALAAAQTAFLKGEISTVRSLQEKVDQLEAALDRLRKEVQEAEDEEMAQRKAADQLKEDVASLKVRLVTCAPLETLCSGLQRTFVMMLQACTPITFPLVDVAPLTVCSRP